MHCTDGADSGVTANTGAAQEGVADDLDADHIGRAGLGYRYAGREDDEVAGLDNACI